MASPPLVSPVFRLPSPLDLLERIHEQTFDSVPHLLRTTVIVVLLAISYYLGTLVGAFLKPQTSMATFWPPSAILLAAFLLAPRRMWWVFLLAVLPVHLLAQVQAGATVLNALGWFVGTVTGALIAAACIRYFNGGPLFDTVRGMVVFLAFGVLVAPLLKSFLDVVVVVPTTSGSNYWLSWTTRLSSNMISGLTLVPIIVLIGLNGLSWVRKVTPGKWVEAGLLALSIVFVSVFVFGRNGVPSGIPSLTIAPLLLLLWAAVRFGPGGLSASLLVVVLVSIWDTMQGRGPLTGGSLGENVLTLHLILAASAVSLMLLAAAVAERRRTADSLRTTRTKLIHSQEQERHRIARELHDDIVQQLTLLGLNIDNLRTQSDYSLKSDLGHLYDQVSNISEAARGLSHNLHPFLLDYLGLVKALGLLCRHAAAESGIDINFEEDAPLRMPADVSLCLYRISQEALQNIVKHSHTRVAGIELKVHRGRALLRITDNGVGMNPEQHRGGGMGIASMRERAMALEGTFKINSAPREGTTIEVSVPLTESSRDSELGTAALL